MTNIIDQANAKGDENHLLQILLWWHLGGLKADSNTLENIIYLGIAHAMLLLAG